ncbi:uncharacterized protein LOC132793531 [Drosophila nasuta]|uniref:Uncharacterized protein LOC117570949 n=1 Tax=Drosophila albomicans TaxID=7291 RepID=A0A6P8X736_DROAB|nr:uncharacterized protein LOC117570949 [Drosophila albomicans]XP_060659481.1 uncharacterized protein LOC132793531 [Drosophila nasuta]
MFKLFLLLSLCAAFAYAAPSLSTLSSLSTVPILSSSTSYHGWPQAVHVVRPVWTPSHTIVRPIIHGNLGLNGYGYGHGWL